MTMKASATAAIVRLGKLSSFDATAIVIEALSQTMNDL